VTLFHVLEHLANPAEVVAGVLRVLRPGGMLVIAVPNNDGFIGKAVHAPLNGPPHHVLRWGERPLRHLADRFSLTVEAMECEPVRPEELLFYRRAMLTHRVARCLGIRPSLYALDGATVFCRKVATALGMALDWLPLGAPKGVPGHAIVACYRKSG